MASPHVAGAAALLLQAHPRTRAARRRRRPAEQRRPRAAGRSPRQRRPRLRRAAGSGAARRRRRDPRHDRRSRPASSRSGTASARRDRPDAQDRQRRGTDGDVCAVQVDALAVAGRDILAEHAEPGPATVAFTRARATRDVGHRAPRRAAEFDVTHHARTRGFRRAPSTAATSSSCPTAATSRCASRTRATRATTRRSRRPRRRRGASLARARDRHHAGRAGSIRPGLREAATPARRSRSRRSRSRPCRPAPITRTGADTPFVLVHMNNHARPDPTRGLRCTRRREPSARRSTRDSSRATAVENVLSPPWSLATALALDGTVRRRAPSRAAPGRRVLPRDDGRAGAGRARDADGDLDVADLPDRPTLRATGVPARRPRPLARRPRGS